MPITNYQPAHAPLLVDFVDSNSDWKGPGRELGRETFRGLLDQPWLDLPNNCFVLLNTGEVKGFSLVFGELPIGRSVIEFATTPENAGTQLEKELLSAALERAKALGAGHAHVCVMPGSSKTGLLKSQGFAQVQTYFDMLWDHQTLEEVPLPAGFRVRHFAEGDAALLTKVQNGAFSGSWGFCPNTVDQTDYRTKMVNTSYEGILFLLDGDAGDTPAGYCWTAMVPVGDKIRGMIGMIGVVPAYRGKGVSRSILHAGMAYLRSAGVDDIGLEVDGSNAPAVGLYTSTGFEKVGEHHWFELVFRGAAKPAR